MAKSPHEQPWTPKTPLNTQKVAEQVNEPAHIHFRPLIGDPLPLNPAGRSDFLHSTGTISGGRYPPYTGPGSIPLPGGIRLRQSNPGASDGLELGCLGTDANEPLGGTPEEDFCIGYI